MEFPTTWDMLKEGKSLVQNIDDIFFSKNAKLSDEYERLFSSAFTNPEEMKGIVEVLYTKNRGYTRAELLEKIKMTGWRNSI